MTKYAPLRPLFAVSFCIFSSVNCFAADNMGLRVNQDYIDANSNNIIISQDISGISGGTGIYIDNISDIDITNSGTYAISGSTTGGRGITISNNSNIIFRNNQGGDILSNTSTGVNIYKTSNSLIENNHPDSTIRSSGSDVIRFSSSNNSTISNSGTIINEGTNDNGSTIYILGSSSTPSNNNNLENSGIISSNEINKLAIRITNYVTGLNINNSGVINGNITSSNDENQINLNNGGIINGDVSLGEGEHNINITGGTINGELKLGLNNNPNITASKDEVITLSNENYPIISAKNSIFSINGEGTLRISGNIIDEFEENNDLIFNLSNGSTLQFTKDITIDGSINSSDGGNIIDIGDNVITLKNNSSFESNSILFLSITDSSYGQLVAQGEDVNITISNNSIIKPKISRMISDDGESFTIVKNQSQTANIDPNNKLEISPEVSDIKLMDSARYNFTLKNDNYDLSLIIQKKPEEDLNLSDNGATMNKILDVAFANDPELLSALNDISSNIELEKAMKELEPQLGSAVVANLRASFRNSIKTVDNRISALKSTEKGVSTGNKAENISTWGQIFGGRSKQIQSSYVNGYRADNSGFTFGFDKKLFTDKLTTGLSLGYSESKISNDSADKVRIDSYQTNLYSSYSLPKDYFIDSSISYSYNINNSNRSININPINRSAQAKYSSHQYGLAISGNKNYKLNNYVITPTLWAQYLRLDTQRYQESGAGSSNLIVSEQTYNNLYSGISAKISRKFSLKDGEISPQITLGYSYEILNKQPIIISKFTGGGGSFTTKNNKPNQHLLNATMGVIFISKNNTELTANYQIEKKKDYISHSGLLNVRFEF